MENAKNKEFICLSSLVTQEFSVKEVHSYMGNFWHDVCHRLGIYCQYGRRFSCNVRSIFGTECCKKLYDEKYKGR